MRARVVLLTGAPGSGKSTLGVLLARELRVPFLARDDIRGGLSFSAGAWGDHMVRLPSADETFDVFLDSVEGLLARGVSCIVEYVVRMHRPADFERLAEAGDCVVVMTACDGAVARLVERNSTDRFIANPAVLDAVGCADVDEHTALTIARMEQVELEMRVEFPVPVLCVDTTGGYEPDLDEIVRFVTAPVCR